MDERNDNNLVTRREFLKTTAMVTAGVAAGGIVQTLSPKSSSAHEPSGTVTVVTSQDANSYDPHSWISEDGRIIGNHIFEALVNRDYEPRLATSWENPDKLTWIFHLKREVGFHNGEPFDAGIVKYSIERYMDPNTKAVYRGLLEPVESLEALDRYTFRIRTKVPYAILIYALREVYMMSPKAVKEAGKDVVRRPVGTGPFRFVEWVPMERTVIEANPDYAGPKAKLKTVIWRPVTEPSTRIVELRAGTADIITKVPPELAGDIIRKGMRVIRMPSLWSMIIMLDLSKPPFDNKKVRLAFSYAADREALIKYVLRGAANVTVDPLKGVAGPNPDIKPYPHDPKKAKQLLAEAGYPNGLDIEVLTPSGRYLKDKALMEALSFQVKEAGFTMKVEAVEWGMFLKTFKSSRAFFVGVEAVFPHQFFSRAFDSRVKSFSWMGYHNDKFNRLLDEAQETFDMEKRNAIYRRLTQIVWEDATFVWLYDPQSIYGIQDRVKDFKPRLDGYIFLKDTYVV